MLSIKLFRLVFCLFWFNRNIKTLCFGIEAKQPKVNISKNQNKLKITGKTLNFLKKYQNMLHIKLFRLLFFCFCSIKTSKNLYFGIEAKQPKQTISKQTKTNKQKPGKTQNFLKKYQNMLHFKLFRLLFCLFRFNRNIQKSLIRYRSETTETNVLFRIMPKLVSVPVSIVLN
jgi:hypothetical protein